MGKKKELFIDTDCLSCFLYTNKGSLLQKLFPNHEIMVPHAVSVEIEQNKKYVATSKKKKAIIDSYNYAKANNYFQIMDDYESDSAEFYMVMQLHGKGCDGGPSIGIGESQVIAAAKCREGDMASNNMSDVFYYINKYKIKNYTASDILYIAYEKGFESETTIEAMWSNLVSVGFKMPTNTFEEFKKRKEKRHA